jgi:hypothetical protein
MKDAIDAFVDHWKFCKSCHAPFADAREGRGLCAMGKRLWDAWKGPRV